MSRPRPRQGLGGSSVLGLAVAVIRQRELQGLRWRITPIFLTNHATIASSVKRRKGISASSPETSLPPEFYVLAIRDVCPYIALRRSRTTMNEDIELPGTIIRYPFIPLDKAIERARELHQIAGRNWPPHHDLE